jgi:murein DD-endopeptidase MepM/ murein hydrolase activator NlpD
MSKILKFGVFLGIFSLIFYGHLFVFASSNTNVEIEQLNKQIESKKDKIKELEETIEKYKKNIDEKRTEAASLKNQMSILNNRIAQTEVDISLTSEKINKTKLEIESLNIAISVKQDAIVKQKKMITKIIQGLQANDQKNFLEIMLTNDNLADFYNQAKYLENVYTDLGRSVKQIRLAKEELDKKKIEAESRHKTYEELLVELDNKKKDLNEKISNKQNLLVTTQSSELKFRTLLDSLRQQYKMVESEVRSYEDQVRKKLSDQEKFKNFGGKVGDFNWPVPGRYVTALFHDPGYPFRRVFEHSGLDIRAVQGTAVRAANSGYVGRAKRCLVSTCYSYVLLIHNGNLSTVYGHLSALAVTEDQYVNRGDIIGYSGGTPGTVGAGPFVTGPHLHFEVRLNGIPVDPLGYLSQ